MAYKDDLTAAHARIAALEQDNVKVQQTNTELKKQVSKETVSFKEGDTIILRVEVHVHAFEIARKIRELTATAKEQGGLTKKLTHSRPARRLLVYRRNGGAVNRKKQKFYA